MKKLTSYKDFNNLKMALFVKGANVNLSKIDNTLKKQNNFS